MQYFVHGERNRETTGETDFAKATKVLKRRRDEIAQGRPAGPEVERTTFDDRAEILRNDYRANGRRSLKRINFALNHLAEYFSGDTRALTITSDRITGYIAHRQKEGAAAA